MTIDSPTPDQFVEVVKVIEDFWLTIVKLPLGKREMSDKHTKILLIEDSPIYTRLVQKILTASSQIEYQIECADRLSTGLEHLVKGEIDSKTLWRVMQYAIERKWTEETLRKSEEKYHTLYESSKDGIVFFGMHGNLLEANPAFLNIFGYTTEEIMKLHYQQLIPKKWHGMEADIVENQIMAKGYSNEYEKEYIKKDGTLLPIIIRLWLISDEQGNPAGMWAIIRDISDQKGMQLQLVQAEKMSGLA